MKLLSVKLDVFLLSCCILLVFGSTQAEGGDWKIYCISDYVFYFYDAESITRSKNVVKVSEKSVVRQIKQCNLTEALREIVEIEKTGPGEMSEESRKRALDGLALQETRRLYEISCQEKRYRIITGMEYDREGTLIDGIFSTKWDSVKPGSIIEKLHQAICY